MDTVYLALLVALYAATLALVFAINRMDKR